MSYFLSYNEYEETSKERHFYNYKVAINMELNILFLKLGLTPCKAEQPLQDMELQEKETQKVKAYRKSH